MDERGIAVTASPESLLATPMIGVPLARATRTPMRRTILKTCAAMIAGASVLATGSAVPRRSRRWIAFYGQTADEQVLASYDFVVLDPMFKGSIDAVAKAGARVCSYLSLGEIRVSDGFYGRVDPAALLEENPAWPGTRRVDVRYRSWKALILGEMIPSIAAKGYTGLLLDTLDTPPYLEQLDPHGKRGMGQATVDLVRAIRQSYPTMLIVANRGYALLPKIINHIDGIVAESLLTTVDETHENEYRWNDATEVALQLSLLANATKRHRRFPVFSLDYWDPEDTASIRKIYFRQRELGHYPYVATRMLDKIIPEPKS